MSRDGSGNYTLPLPDVITGTVIEASWANSTLGDIETEMTDSLSRSGSGGMTAPLKIIDGTESLPGLCWSSEANTGLYRFSANEIRMTVGGGDMFRWSVANGVQVYESGSWRNITQPAGGANNETIRYDSATQKWVANVNVTATAAGDFTALGDVQTGDLTIGDGNGLVSRRLTWDRGQTTDTYIDVNGGTTDFEIGSDATQFRMFWNGTTMWTCNSQANWTMYGYVVTDSYMSVEKEYRFKGDQATDPIVVAGVSHLYTKDDGGGTSELWFQPDAGTAGIVLVEGASGFDLQYSNVVNAGNITSAGNITTTGGNITTSGGSISAAGTVTGTAGLTTNTYLRLVGDQAGDPTPTAGSSHLYTKDNGGGESELWFQGDAGTAVNLSSTTSLLSGSFSPTIQDGSHSNSEGQTYSSQNGRFNKNGDMVWFSMSIIWTSLGTLSGALKIADLPYTARAGQNVMVNVAGTCFDNTGTYTAGTVVTGYIQGGTNRIELQKWTGLTGIEQLLRTDVYDGAATLLISGMYEV